MKDRQINLWTRSYYTYRIHLSISHSKMVIWSMILFWNWKCKDWPTGIQKLGNDEQWNISENEIDWHLIVNSMLYDERTHNLGFELKSLVFDPQKS